MELTPPDGQRHRPLTKRSVALTVLFGGLALVAAVFMFARSIELTPTPRETGPVSSCEGRGWPTTEISCTAAENKSVTAIIPAQGPWSARIWLTTLEAVDERLHTRRQVANHPTSQDAWVWLFIYESPTGERVLYVAAASSAGPGAFVYTYRWSELGSPDIPTTMPAVP